MMAFTALLYPAFLGYLAVECILRTVSLPRACILKVCLALPVGFGILSLLMFLAYGLSPLKAPWIVLGLATALCLLLAWGIFRQKKAPPACQSQTARISFWDITAAILLALALLRFFSAAGTVALHFPQGEWDARLFWNAKAKFLLRNPESWKLMFSPLLAWAHPDYPLMLPSTIAWGWQWCGRESMLWPHLTGLVFALSMAGTLGWYLGVKIRPAAGCLAAAVLLSLDFFRYWAASEYADIPLACLMTQAAVLLASGGLENRLRPFLLAGFLAGLAAWTKNEGMLYGSLIAGGALTTPRLRDKKWDIVSFLGFILGISIPFMAIFVLKAILSPHGDYIGSGRSSSEILAAIFGSPAKTLLILKGFWSYTLGNRSWNLLWQLFTLSLGVLVVRGKVRACGRFFAVLVLFQMAGYFLIIHVSPHPPAWQIETALTRLLLHLSGLVILTVFCGLAPARTD